MQRLQALNHVKVVACDAFDVRCEGGVGLNSLSHACDGGACVGLCWCIRVERGGYRGGGGWGRGGGRRSSVAWCVHVGHVHGQQVADALVINLHVRTLNLELDVRVLVERYPLEHLVANAGNQPRVVWLPHHRVPAGKRCCRNPGHADGRCRLWRLQWCRHRLQRCWQQRCWQCGGEEWRGGGGRSDRATGERFTKSALFRKSELQKQQ
jgi:hypothetical protein